MSQKTIPTRPLAFLETFADWQTTMSGDPVDPVFTFHQRRPRPVNTDSSKPRELFKQIDIFNVRERLFESKEPEQVFEFFQLYGPWQLLKDFDNQAATIKFSQVERRRESYESALLSKTFSTRLLSADEDSMATFLEDWYLWQPLKMEMPFGQPPFARCKDIEDALRATFFIDKLDGLPWKRCASERCRKPFKIEKDPRRKYCDPDCAHYQAATDWNRREQKKRALAGLVRPKKG